MAFRGLQCIADTQALKRQQGVKTHTVGAKKGEGGADEEEFMSTGETPTYSKLSSFQKNNAYAFVGSDAVGQELSVFFDVESLMPVFASY